ncbi:NAD(P)-dependent oxidoreductase [Methanorbis rubei]|uniref:dTDP-6-deoxy-L-talose 4-dehydrogenase (NAD(+)) n=1 Tax=Methanorbis rubei TaxID=3028300 RepID=A0AAE4SBJ7_9EURY|nr:dTDP-6-deoxy-L-talose 4-dehydrogenase (NAD(+)) [Methanocorpusculaceae archaeon Cs1]
MKILVTGATGFVGHYVVQWLVDHDYDVVATATSDEKAKKFAWYDSVKFVACDYYSEEKNFYEFFGEPDILIHLAWKGLPNYMMRFHLEENLPAEMRFLRSFAETRKTKIVITGTCYEYGVVNGCLSEDMPANPTTVYGVAKDTLRRYLSFLAGEYGFSWNWVRLFFLYGKGQSPKSLLPQLDAAIERGDTEFPMSGGEQLRDYLLVEKVAEYVCRIALQDAMSGVVNCCSGKMISVRQLVEERVSELGAEISLKLGVYGYPAYEGMAFWGDVSRLHEVIDDA